MRLWHGWASALVALLLLAPGAEAASPRASGGVRLVEAMETAPLTVVGVVRQPVRLDAHGHAATLAVETVLHGEVSAGAALKIAWEELAASRASRFLDGERLLLCLEPLPGASIWLGRFPDAKSRELAWAVALRGDAFLRSPSLGTLSLLEHYLALARRAREALPGSELLVELVAGAELPIAVDAARRLEARPGLADDLDAAAASRLVGALLRSDARPALEDAIVSLIGTRKLEAARPALARLAAARPRPPSAVYAALASLSGGLPADEVAALLDDAPTRYRELAARQASGAGADELLRGLAHRDREPEVRAAALQRLLELERASALEPLVAGLGDEDERVRGVAVHALASLGDIAIPSARRIADANDPLAAQAAVAVLGLLPSKQARAALVEIADEHPDEGLRALAKVALGRPIGHTD